MATERRSPNVFSLGDTLDIGGYETRIVELLPSGARTKGRGET